MIISPKFLFDEWMHFILISPALCTESVRAFICAAWILCIRSVFPLFISMSPSSISWFIIMYHIRSPQSQGNNICVHDTVWKQMNLHLTISSFPTRLIGWLIKISCPALTRFHWVFVITQIFWYSSPVGCRDFGHQLHQGHQNGKVCQTAKGW